LAKIGRSISIDTDLIERVAQVAEEEKRSFSWALCDLAELGLLSLGRGRWPGLDAPKRPSSVDITVFVDEEKGGRS